MSEETVHTIDKLNARIRAIVEKETLDKPLWVGGVVRRVHLSDFGHIYFSLSDDPFSIRCMLRENRRGSIGFTPQNNMEVEVFGSVRVYDQSALVQVEVEDMRLIEGQLMTNYQPIEALLSKKGLWPPEKRPLPQEIKRIGIITSKQGEALLDFENNYRNAEGTAAVDLADVRIQGQYAAQEISDAIIGINRAKEVDVIVLTRGGGRQHDMTVFDDILIAGAICRSDIPVVTAIGHERNTFFADQVSDMSVSTPTAAAFLLAKPQPQANEKKSCSSIIGVAMVAVIASTIALYLLAT